MKKLGDFLKNFLFYVGVWLVNNVVIVSGGQPRDPDIHTHVAPFSPNSLPFQLPQNFEQSSSFVQ